MDQQSDLTPMEGPPTTHTDSATVDPLWIRDGVVEPAKEQATAAFGATDPDLHFFVVDQVPQELLTTDSDAAPLECVGIRVGKKLGERIATAVTNKGLTTAAAVSASAAMVEAAETSIMLGAAQLHALRAAVIRLPIAPECVDGFCEALIGNMGAAETAHIAAMDLGTSVFRFGIQANVIGIAAGAMVTEGVAGVCYLRGAMTKDELKRHSVDTAVASVAGIGGGAVGCAVGTLICPGMGTTLGSLIGSCVGMFLAPTSADKEGEENAAPTTATKGPDDEQWMLVNMDEKVLVLTPEQSPQKPPSPTHHAPQLPLPATTAHSGPIRVEGAGDGLAVLEGFEVEFILAPVNATPQPQPAGVSVVVTDENHFA